MEGLVRSTLWLKICFVLTLLCLILQTISMGSRGWLEHEIKSLIWLNVKEWTTVVIDDLDKASYGLYRVCMSGSNADTKCVNILELILLGSDKKPKLMFLDEHWWSTNQQLQSFGFVFLLLATIVILVKLCSVALQKTSSTAIIYRFCCLTAAGCIAVGLIVHAAGVNHNSFLNEIGASQSFSPGLSTTALILAALCAIADIVLQRCTGNDKKRCTADDNKSVWLEERFES